MPDPSLPEFTPFNGLHSAVPTLMGVEKRSDFSSFVGYNQEPWQYSWHGEGRAYQPENSALLSPLAFHAEPLAPLRQRDEQALATVFEEPQVEEIIADICARLKQLYPEPCWDDEAFDFLNRYL